MIEMVQLQDGCYRVTLDICTESFRVHREWIFREAESGAEVDEGGEHFRFLLMSDK